MATVYQHIRLDNNTVFYIGIGKDNYRPYSKHSRTKYWYNIVNKYGYKVEIIEDNIEWEKALEKEIELIYKIGRKDLGKGTLINMTNGGQGTLGQIFSRESLLKKSISMKGKLSGEKNPMFGKKGILNPNFNKSQTEEHKKKISQSNSGKPKSIEHINKLKKRVGILNSSSKIVLQFDLNNNFIKEFESGGEAERHTNISSSSILKCCNNKRKTAGKYIWKFKN